MPEVITAKSAGYCFGVRRAVDAALEAAQDAASSDRKSRMIYTLGPLIHNKQVITDLAARGITPLATPDKEEDLRRELERVQDGVLIIRSHGVSRAVLDLIRKMHLNYIDATCPFVERIHKIVCEEEAKGRKILVVGNPDHPEVQGICGWCRGEVTVLSDCKDAQGFKASKEDAFSLVVQTTFRNNKFTEIVEILEKVGYNLNVLNTICSATAERQSEAEEIASEVDVMLVVGDAGSSNTQKLFEICNTRCKNTFYVQIPEDLDLNFVRSVKTIGITAGASTPNNIIEEVQNLCQKN